MCLPVVSDAGHSYTLKECRALERKVAKLENIIKVLKSVPCTVSAPLKEKLDALETLQGAFDVYTLCEALEVARGTFYNHILRNKRNEAWYEKYRRECKLLIQQVYDENNQIFGAAKIRTLLCEQGFQTSVKYVAELMQEMGLNSVTTKSKKGIFEVESVIKEKHSQAGI